MLTAAEEDGDSPDIAPPELFDGVEGEALELAGPTPDDKRVEAVIKSLNKENNGSVIIRCVPHLLHRAAVAYTEKHVLGTCGLCCGHGMHTCGVVGVTAVRRLLAPTPSVHRNRGRFPGRQPTVLPPARRGCE